MTNAEKLAKEMINNLDDFAKILFNGICHLRKCDDCPLKNVYKCVNTEHIEKWLESEAKEDDEIH